MSTVYKNILVIITGFLIIYLFLLLKFDNDVRTLLYIVASIGFLSLISSRLARGINWIWLRLALALGWINSRILLGIVFYVFMFPLAIVSRIFTKDPLNLKTQKDSVYAERNHLYTKEDLENIW